MRSGSSPRVGVIIAAGGSGRRVGTNLPKQFLPLAGKTVMERTIAVFASLDAVDQIVLVVPAGYVERTKKLVKKAGLRKVAAVVPGGKERQDSVWCGLNAFPCNPEILLVHDAVRPLIDHRTIAEVIDAAGREGAAVVGLRAKETIKEESPAGYYARTLDRERLWLVQTPQGFRYNLLREAHEQAARDGFTGTDEGSLAERMGFPVRIVEGSERNIKITTKDDFALASMLVRMKQGRRRLAVRKS